MPKAALTTIFGAFSPILFFEIPKVAKEKPLTESSPYFFANFTRVLPCSFFYINQLQKAMTYVLYRKLGFTSKFLSEI